MDPLQKRIAQGIEDATGASRSQMRTALREFATANRSTALPIVLPNGPTYTKEFAPVEVKTETVSLQCAPLPPETAGGSTFGAAGAPAGTFFQGYVAAAGVVSLFNFVGGPA